MILNFFSTANKRCLSEFDLLQHGEYFRAMRPLKKCILVCFFLSRNFKNIWREVVGSLLLLEDRKIVYKGGSCWLQQESYMGWCCLTPPATWASIEWRKIFERQNSMYLAFLKHQKNLNKLSKNHWVIAFFFNFLDRQKRVTIYSLFGSPWITLPGPARNMSIN